MGWKNVGKIEVWKNNCFDGDVTSTVNIFPCSLFIYQGELSLLLSKVMDFKVNDFKKMLRKSEVVNMVPLLCALSEGGYDKFRHSTMMQLIHDSNPREKNFRTNYEDALARYLLDITDKGMAAKLRTLVEENKYNAIDIIVITCEHANTFLVCGHFLNNYCSEMSDITQTSNFIIEGMNTFDTF